MSGGGQLPTQAWQRLRSALGETAVASGADAAAAGARPEPAAWLRPVDASGVALVLASARAEGLPVAVRSAAAGGRRRSGLPPGGHLLLDTSRLSGVEDLKAESLWMTVRAGMGLEAVIQAAAAAGCRPVDMEPAAAASVGAWLAGRSRIADDVLGIPQPAVAGLEAVLADGTLVRSVQTPRSAVGPDLFSLLLGTRGTFGVITSACLKLEPLPERRLMAGLRFRSLKRAFAFVHQALDGLLPPRRLQLLVDGQKGRRMARVWFAVEGQADLAAATMRWLRDRAEAGGGELRELERVRAWRAASVFSGRRSYRAGVRWSQLERVLRGADRLMGGYAFAVLDRPESTGCRLRVAAPRRLSGDPRPGWKRLVDPDGAQAEAAEQARTVLARVRAELDPDGLLDPQHWPLD